MTYRAMTPPHGPTGRVVHGPFPVRLARLAIALVSLATALAAFLWDGWHRQLQLPPRAILWLLLGLWALAIFQLIPLPEALHRALAPGSPGAARRRALQ